MNGDSTSKITVLEYFVSMPDGVRLFTRVMLPAAPAADSVAPAADSGMARYPIVFHRSPYEPGLSAASFVAEDMKGPLKDFLDGGYAVVSQHCRGTGQSEGVFRNMIDERGDGLDTLDWIRAQEWYGGDIYLYGNSYKSFVHSAYISAHPADVRAAVLSVMPSNMFYVCYEKNTFKHDLYTLWFTRLYKKNQLDAEEKFAQVKEELKIRPLAELPERLYGHPVPELTEPFAHSLHDDEFWCSHPGHGDSYDAPHTIDCPLLLIGGYYDIHFKGTLDYWERLNESVKPKSAMLIGPWGHAHNTHPDHEALFPDSYRGHPELEWFDYIRKGNIPPAAESNNSPNSDIEAPGRIKKCAPHPALGLGKVTYYCAGEGWRQVDYLGADSREILTVYPSADGGLKFTAPESGVRSYDYDPKNPALFPGGANVFQSGNAGLQPQPQPNFRADVISFLSEPFERDVTLDGEIRIKLEVSSDCRDTAFFVRADAERGGVMWYLRDTIVNLRDELGDYKPGQRVTLNFVLDPVAWVIRRGERLRFDVSSSNFPIYNAHANTSVYWANAKKTRVAHNSVYMEGSAFLLSVRD